MIKQIYFISTGQLSAMFTLNVIRQTDDPHVNQFMRPNYICNLAAAGEENELRAIEKAKAYTEAMRERIGEREDFKIEFGGVWEEAIMHRRGKLSVRDTANLEMIEQGKFPFGKHRGERIEDAPESYVLFFADKYGTDDNVVLQALAAAAQGVALEKGYISRREEQRAIRAAEDAKSEYIGEVGQRLDFEGVVITSFFKGDGWGGGYFINKVRTPEGIVAALGSVKLGELGETVRFKATIKSHDEYKGVKSTRVNRPKILETA